MKYIGISKDTKLIDIANMVGDRNVSAVLNANGLDRAVNIGKNYIERCREIMDSETEVDWKTKATILNNLTGDYDVFEKASLLGSRGWKVLAKTGAFSDYIQIPSDIYLPASLNTLGDGVITPKTIYQKVVKSITSPPHFIDPNIYNDYSSMMSVMSDELVNSNNTGDNSVFQSFHLPWGQVRFYDSISDSSIDFPVYPEEIADKRSANYDSMPDIIYQYEPWLVYQSSGPRQISLSFHMHRQMWSGNEQDGKANELIRFCMAALYPDYNGSSVNSATCKMYIAGETFISGVLNDVSVNWTGPISSIDGYYLEFTVELSFTEVAESPLNHNSVKGMKLIG